MSESEVFYNIFTSNMNEAKTNVIQIQDIKSNIMSGFIDFLHLHYLKNFDSIAQELFEMGDKYSVKTLIVSFSIIIFYLWTF